MLPFDHLPPTRDAHRANPFDKIPLYHPLPDLGVQLLELGVARGLGRFGRAREGRRHASIAWRFQVAIIVG